MAKQTPCQGLTLGVPSCHAKKKEIPLTPAQNKLRNSAIVKQLGWLALHSFPFSCLFH